MHTIRELKSNSKNFNFLIFIHYIFLNKKIMIFSKQNLYKLKKMLLSLSEIPTKEGIVLITDSDDMEVGLEVFVDGDAGLMPAPDGEYTVDDNIVVVEGGKIVEIKEKPLDQPIETPEEIIETPMQEEEKPEENPIDNPIDNPEEPMEPSIDELKNLIEEQKTMIEELKSENETLKAEIEDLKKKLEEPLAQPAEEQFKNEKPNEKETKIDFSKYIKRK